MADATGKNGVATEHIQEAELTESPENAAADARGSAADSTISGNAKGHNTTAKLSLRAIRGEAIPCTKDDVLNSWLRAWLRAWAAGAKHARYLKMGDAVKIWSRRAGQWAEGVLVGVDAAQHRVRVQYPLGEDLCRKSLPRDSEDLLTLEKRVGWRVSRKLCYVLHLMSLQVSGTTREPGN